MGPTPEEENGAAAKSPEFEDDNDAIDEARVLVLYTGGTIGMALKGIHLGAHISNIYYVCKHSI